MTMIYYGGRLFSPVSTQGASETSSATVFKYEQTGNMVIATYSGGDIQFGHLLGTVNKDGSLDFRYHHRNKNNELMAGLCHTEPEVLDNGKLRLHETWQWTSGDKTHGTSILEEI